MAHHKGDRRICGSNYSWASHIRPIECRSSSAYPFHLLGSAFFRDLYAVTGAVPAGTYTVHLYLNGMWTNSASFSVV